MGVVMRGAKGQPLTRVGVVGTGFIARGLYGVIRGLPDMTVSRALTRRSMQSCIDVPKDVKLTQSVQELIDHSDVVVEVSGDVLHAAEVIRDVLAAGLPVITMNSEFHVTCGSYFVDKGYLSEAEGDQPGCTAALREEALAMGFTPMVYGNMKGFLNPDPTHDEMVYWSERQGIRVEQTVSFTDGTKVQMEQAFVANGFGAGIAQDGLLAPVSDDFDAVAHELAEAADKLGFPICDFVVSRGQPPGVFVVASHDSQHQAPLRYMKMGDGPYYVLVRPFHLCAFEIPKTIRRATFGLPPLLNNSRAPTVSVAAIAKRAIKPGEKIDLGVGSFLVRGRAVRIADNVDHVPIGLLYNAVITRQVEPGQMLTLDDVELPESYARDITLGLLRAAAA